MKTVLVLLVCLAGVLAFPQRDQDVQITSQTNDNDGSGNYRNSYSLSDGTNREETGEFQAGREPETGNLVQRGTVSYISPEGQTIQYTYVADSNGYRAEGAHLPK